MKLFKMYFIAPSTGIRAVSLHNGVPCSCAVSACINKTGLLQKEVDFFHCPQSGLGRIERHHCEIHQGFELGERIVVMVTIEAAAGYR